MSRENPRIALMMSSYARVPEALSQIRAMMLQSYKNVHMFVAIKGISESIYFDLIVPQVRPFVNEGRLDLCLAGNTNQLINFLDSVRGHNVDEYDIFLKIDDDDFYHPDYIKYVAKAVQMCAPGTSTFCGWKPSIKTLYARYGTWITSDTFKEKDASGYGHMLGLGRPILDHLFLVERKPSTLKWSTQLMPWQDGMNIGWREDRYIFEMLRRLGPCVDIHPLFTRAGIEPSYIGGYSMNGSWTRNPEYRNSEFLQRVRSFEKNPHPPREWFIELEDGRVMRLFDGYYNFIGIREKHRYVTFKNGRLELKSGKVYKRRVDGRYYVEAPRDSGGD